MDKEIVYVYRIYFPMSGKSYIGQTNDMRRRMEEHLRVDNGSLVHRALLKYNDWEISILHTCQSRDETNKLEIEEILNFGSLHPGGYNLVQGGGGGGIPDFIRKRISDTLMGHDVSKESRDKMSKAVKLRGLGPIEKLAEFNRGKKQAPEHTAKISDSLKGHEVTPSTRKKIGDAHRGEKSSCWGKELSAEHRKKISDAQRGEKHHFYGKKLSAEHCKKISDANKGFKVTDETKEKIRATLSGRKQDRAFVVKRMLAVRRNHIKRLTKQFEELKEQAREQGIGIDRFLIEEKQVAQQ